MSATNAHVLLHALAPLAFFAVVIAVLILPAVIMRLRADS